MAWWDRKPKGPRLEYSHPRQTQADPRTSVTELDRLVADAHHHACVPHEDAAWKALTAQYPKALAEDERPLVVTVAKAFSASREWGTLVFATNRRLISAGNLQRMLSYDFALIQSVGVIVNGLSETDHPELQVLVAKEAGSTDLTLGRYQLLPTEEMGIFWKSAREAIKAQRPDLKTHYAGMYGGLGVPPPADDGAPWYAPSPPRPRGW